MRMNIYEYIREHGNKISQEYGWTDFAKKNDHLYGPSGHPGIDYVPEVGNEVRSLFGGKVVKVHYKSDNENSPDGYYDNPYGNYVIVLHGDKRVYYAHLKQIRVQKGNELLEGDHIGIMGMTGEVTGAHVHLEVRDKNGKTLDPEVWFIHEGSKQQTNEDDMTEEQIRKNVRMSYKKFGGRTDEDLEKEQKHVENWVRMIKNDENTFANLDFELLVNQLSTK